MKQIIDKIRQLPIWGKVAIGVGCGFLLFFLLTQIQSCSDKRMDRKAERELDAIKTSTAPLAKTLDSLGWEIGKGKTRIDTLQKQVNEAHANTIAAQRKLDSIRARLK